MPVQETPFQHHVKRQARCELSLHCVVFCGVAKQFGIDTASAKTLLASAGCYKLFPQLVLHNTAPVTTNQSPRIAATALLVAHIRCHTILSMSWTELPHVTTDPSPRMAAKTYTLAWICCTFVSLSRTALLSPPWTELPHVTTDPSPLMAAKASPLAWICCTCFSLSWTTLLSPPVSEMPHRPIA